MLVEKSFPYNAIKYAMELISTPSLSGMERDIAYLIKDLLSREGVDKVFIDSYGSVVGVLEGGIDKTIVLEGHMDHVPPGDRSLWRIDPYKPVVIDGLLYGRGSADMKGAIASMIASISLVNKAKDLPTTYYVFVPYEEIAEGLVFKYTIEDSLGIEPDLVVLGEATSLNISLGQRGRAVIYIEVLGKTAHASMHYQGINALAISAKIINSVVELDKRLPSHGILGKSTIVPTIISCKPESPPMIPDYCRIIVDRRFIVGEDKDSIVSEVEKAVKTTSLERGARGYRVGIVEELARMWTGRELKAIHYFPAWLQWNNIYGDKALDMIRQEIVSNAEKIVWRFSTDGVYSAGEAGYNTIGFGPAMEELAHKPNEYVPVKHLEKATIGYRLLVSKIFKN